MKDPRFLAVQLLDKTFRSGSYSNIQLGSGLEKSEMSDRDKRLCSVIYYGVIERKITLDYIISQLVKRPIEKLDLTVLNILRCGVYQLLFMDNIPDNAAVNESVTLAKKFKKASASGMVNAVLRNLIRRDKQYAIPMDILISSSIEYSAPVWMIDSFIADYGMENMTDLLSDALKKPPVTVRFNTLKATEDEIISQLGNIKAEKSLLLENCYELDGGDVTATDAFKNGLLHVQDKASQLCCRALNPTADDKVLDLCSAPGGKTFTMAEMMNGKGEIYACDLHEKRVKLIADGAKRLGLENIKTMAADASVYNEKLPKFSKILCDVPCSGLGVIRRKPEIKYKNPSDFEGLPTIQYKIAENALNYLEVGGEMVYSTCTLRKEENERVIEKLIENHPEIEGVSFLEDFGEPFGSFYASIFPKYFGSDGFFISKIRKVR
ncbi:MAG: 16S rRNA (cytosine(967)-C(5))-methyltransferase RsmB [Ruminococcus sp.]|nr:16S rRNA (cytosine(967)-C(5))-methyltransferase RsmB [Ruminococcus sp.]MBR6669519.1 16S rRNA (cytosine(967)-C(5))-methyltransferase RsmB [Ruminococcus sp.]